MIDRGTASYLRVRYQNVCILLVKCLSLEVGRVFPHNAQVLVVFRLMSCVCVSGPS